MTTTSIDCLERALVSLEQQAELEKLSTVLKDELIITREDLVAILRDASAWRDLKLPLRVKVESKNKIFEESKKVRPRMKSDLLFRLK